jgi:hypothetical protein
MESAVTIAAIICLLIVSIILNRGSYYVINNACSKFQKVLLTDEYKSLKSGDIILFAPILHNFTNSIITQNLFAHIAIVVNDPVKGLCVSETNGQTRIKKSAGAHIFKLLARLKNYDGCFYLMRLNKPLDKQREELLIKTANEVIDHSYPGFKEGVLYLMGGSFEARHCFMHVAFLLEKIKLLPEGFKPDFITSSELSSFYKQQLPDDYRFEFPVQLIYDIPDGLT